MTNTTPPQHVSKILFPIDGSESSMLAAAIELAKLYCGYNETRHAEIAREAPSNVEEIALYVVDVTPKFELLGKHGLNCAEYAQAAVQDAKKGNRKLVFQDQGEGRQL